MLLRPLAAASASAALMAVSASVGERSSCSRVSCGRDSCSIALSTSPATASTFCCTISTQSACLKRRLNSCAAARHWAGSWEIQSRACLVVRPPQHVLFVERHHARVCDPRGVAVREAGWQPESVRLLAGALRSNLERRLGLHHGAGASAARGHRDVHSTLGRSVRRGRARERRWKHLQLIRPRDAAGWHSLLGTLVREVAHRVHRALRTTKRLSTRAQKAASSSALLVTSPLASAEA